MNEKRINVKNEIKTNLAVTSDKAQYIYTLLSESVKKQQKVIIDFSGIETLTTAFLNKAIGELYAVSDPNTLNEFIKIDTTTLTPLQRNKIALVMKNAKNKLSKSTINEDMNHGN